MHILKKVRFAHFKRETKSLKKNCILLSVTSHTTCTLRSKRGLRSRIHNRPGRWRCSRRQSATLPLPSLLTSVTKQPLTGIEAFLRPVRGVFQVYGIEGVREGERGVSRRVYATFRGLKLSVRPDIKMLHVKLIYNTTVRVYFKNVLLLVVRPHTEAMANASQFERTLLGSKIDMAWFHLHGTRAVSLISSS